MVDLHKRGI